MSEYKCPKCGAISIGYLDGKKKGFYQGNIAGRIEMKSEIIKIINTIPNVPACNKETIAISDILTLIGELQ